MMMKVSMTYGNFNFLVNSLRRSGILGSLVRLVCLRVCWIPSSLSLWWPCPACEWDGRETAWTWRQCQGRGQPSPLHTPRGCGYSQHRGWGYQGSLGPTWLHRFPSRLVLEGCPLPYGCHHWQPLAQRHSPSPENWKIHNNYYLWCYLPLFNISTCIKLFTY